MKDSVVNRGKIGRYDAPVSASDSRAFRPATERTPFGEARRHHAR